MAITVWSALWFLPFALPICIWVAWNDMKFMKIPNKAVLALIGVFLIVGLVALPLADIPWRLLHFVVVLAIGFGLNMLGSIGAGDAKAAAAIAPFIDYGDVRVLFYLFAAAILAAVTTHRGVRRIKAITNLAPDWASWTTRDFPMGLALGGTLAFYLIAGVFLGS